jgi:uncharacterized protein (TIGR03437 family)
MAAQAVAQQPALHTVNVTFSATGKYTVGEGGDTADLDGNGQFTYLGPVNFHGTVQVTSPGKCTVYFQMQAIHQNPDGTTTSGPEYVSGIGRGQTCDTDNPTDGFPSAAVAIWGGQLAAGGGETTEVHGGYLTFTLVGRDFGWGISGQGEINLVPANAQTAGPGGSGYPPVVAGPGGSGYPIVINGANSGSVLVFNTDNAASGASGELPHATSGASSIQIPLPVQSAASTYSVSANCADSTANCWIEVPTASGSIAANSSATISANVSPAGLSPGVYSAMVAITITPGTGQTASNTINVPLTAIVAAGADLLGLSQTGFQFQTFAGAPAQSESISISNLAAGSLPFSTSVSTPSGETWLSVSPTTDTATSAAPAIANVQANPAGLTPGTYFGRVDVSAPGAVNAAQSIDVALTVLPVSNNTTPVLSPAAMSVVGDGTGKPVVQNIQLSTLSDQQLPFAAAAITNDGANWLAVSPSNGNVTAAQPLLGSITLQPSILKPGVYNGTVVLQNTNDNSTYSVSVQLVVPRPAPCTPAQLLPVITNLGPSSEIIAAQPVPFQARIVDDCGSPMTSGSVVASFSSGDPAVSMLPIGNGQWAGTWLPHSIAGGGVLVTLSASSSAPPLSGSTTATGIISANPTAPVVNQAAVVSAAAPTTHRPLAPGAFISIFGSNLATAPTPAASLPLSTLLSDTQVLLGGQPLLLNFVSPGQINAVVPYGARANSIEQLVVIHKGVYSPVEPLVVAPTQPAVFTQDQSGTGAGVITVVKPDGTQFLNTASTPATSGDTLVIYCAGLGLVNPAVPDGSAAPASPPARTINPVTVTIGGQTASAAFSGLVPGFAGLYQVNVTVPGGISPAADVPLMITAGSVSSPAVTLAVR